MSTSRAAHRHHFAARAAPSSLIRMLPRRRLFARRDSSRSRIAAFVIALLVAACLILVPGARLTARPAWRAPGGGEGDDRVSAEVGADAVQEVSAGGVRAPAAVSEARDEGLDGGIAGGMGVMDGSAGVGGLAEAVRADAVVKAVGLEEREGVGGVEESGVEAGAVGGGVPAPRVSAVVLFHNEYETLLHTLETWESNDLLAHVTEVLFFLNGVASGDSFLEKLPVLKKESWKDLVRVVPSAENLKLGLAINRMVQLANEENVLLLEKDWALIEPPQEVSAALGNAARLLDEGAAHVVRFRHRQRPGAPLHARIMHENREEQMLQQQSNLYCYLHHWVEDPVDKYGKFFTKCSDRDADASTWCAKAKYCQWTNNPALFKKDWFVRELGEKYVAMYNQTIETNPTSGMLDFEFYTNWQADVWNGRDFVVALPRGLFEHQEVGEQNLMNTVWYAWSRLETDATEKRRALFASERAECDTSVKTKDSGPLWKDKFPIDFVRLYHYNRSMEREVSDGIAELEDESLAVRPSLNANKGSWRHGVTTLTNLWYKVALFTYPEEPKDMRLKFVTALFETEGKNAGEPSSEDIQTICANLDSLSSYKLAVYCSADTKIEIEKTLKDLFQWDATRIAEIDFTAASLNATLTSALGSETLGHVEKIHGSSEWQTRASNRSGGDVPSLGKVALSMSKPYVLHEAMMQDTTNSTHYVWYDARSRCFDRLGRDEQRKLRSDNDSVLRGHLLLGILASGVRVNSAEELEAVLTGSGFSSERLLAEMEIREGIRDVMVLDGKTLGGSRLAIALLKAYYDVAVRSMLRSGELGTGREALSIVHQNVGYNFAFFDGASACRDGDTECGERDVLDRSYMQEDGTAGCKLFRWAGSCMGSGG